MATIRLAVIGTGARAMALLEYVRRNPEMACVKFAADPDSKARGSFALQFELTPTRVYSDWQALLDQRDIRQNIDAVLIATPDNQHYAPAIAFLEAGFPVLLEKPLSPNEDECRQIVEVARRAKGFLAVCHVLRYTPYTKTVKTLVDSGVAAGSGRAGAVPWAGAAR